MSATRLLARHVRCQGCQRNTLNVFAGFAGLTINALPQASTRSFPGRQFTTGRAVRASDPGKDHSDNFPAKIEQQLPPEKSDDVFEDLEAHAARSDPVTSTVATSEDSEIPWYLQLQESDRSAKQHQSRQQLPELPQDSPENLGIMVEHLFMDIGLDDIRILDLRTMNPPPALGNNLIMILGTARSERHLHVSADRFCRWLRSTYKLRPYADGLLGRNELKIRLRRKAKRAKLLGSKGPVEGEVDDGIRTGWVCVNVGAVEKSKGSRQEELDKSGIVGFSSEEDGTHLVVQMMTEQKREELDLESLWLDALVKQEKEDAQRRTTTGGNQQFSDNATQVGSSNTFPAPEADTMLTSSRQPRHETRPDQQARGFHTMRNLRRQATFTPNNIASESSLTETERAIRLEAVARWQLLEDNGMRDRLDEFWNIDRPRLAEPYESSLETLAALSEESAVSMLGAGPHDLESTAFLRKSFSDIRAFEGEGFWTCRLWTSSYAMLLGHPAYEPDKIQGLFALMESDLPQVPVHLYRLAVDVFAPCSAAHVGPLQKYPAVTDSTLAFLTSALAQMKSLDPKLDNGFVFERLYLAKLRAFLANDPNEDVSIPGDELEKLGRLGGVTGSHGPYTLSEGFHLNTLHLLALLSSDLEPFLNHWESIPIYSQSRSPALYSMFFEYLASSGNEMAIVKALDEWVDMMELESPPVHLEGAVADGVLACLNVLRPDIEQVAASDMSGDDAYLNLWRRCKEGTLV